MNFGEYLDSHKTAVLSIDENLIRLFLDSLSSLRESGKTLWVAGNGGSSATASHAVADFTKTINQTGRGGIKTFALSEMVSLQTAFANDNSFVDGFHDTLRFVGTQGDVLLAISVSGKSPNLLQAARAARQIGMPVLSMVGELGAPLAELSDICILINSSDYQVVENIQLALIHWFVKELTH
jgi:phosphoheptose isomerase